MKEKKSKRLIAWIMLFILIGITLMLTYLKYFPTNNTNIEEKPINESSSNAIHTALKDITTNFNQSPKVKAFEEENSVILKASVNNYSIYISYINDTTTTFEFTYDDLNLNITINDTEEDKIKFNVIYQILIEAVQTRINNNDDISSIIDAFLNTDVNYEGLTKRKVENTIEYQMNITNKLK